MSVRVLLAALLLIGATLAVTASERSAHAVRIGGAADGDATFRFARALGSNMVLQREPASARIWGWAAPNTAVSCTFAGQQFPTQSSSSGLWSVDLPPWPAGGPHDISCTQGSTTISLWNVMFGEVFICSGQSNMQFSVPAAFNATLALKEAEQYPNIRLFTVGQTNYSSKPLDDLAHIEQPWTQASAVAVNGTGSAWTYFSAVCWWYGVHVHAQSLAGQVPVGLISSNWGGTFIAAWVSDSTANQCGPTNSSQPPNANSVLYNAMIAPLAPMRVRGAIWYQGEQDVLLHDDPSKFYACMQPLLVDDWRQTFQNPALSFFFVQLAAYTELGPYGFKLGTFRIAQEAGLARPGTCMATAVDLGDADPHNPYGNIHPRNKQTVGERLGACADALLYQRPAVLYGPQPLHANGSSSGHILVEFGNVPHALTLRPEPTCPVAATECGGWLLMRRSGRVTVPARVTLQGPTTVRLEAGAGVTDAELVAYGVADWPLLSVYGETGLPATPFVLPVSA